jgi:predicted nucleic acid-binding protein
MIVLDASALIDLFVYPRPNAALRRRVESAGALNAPHLLDLELLDVLRRLVRVGVISADRADVVRDDVAGLPVHRYPHDAMADRIWALRHNLTAYDAAYVALAEVLDCPFVTADGRIARASGHAAEVEVYKLN